MIHFYINLIFLLFMPLTALAHPHVFVECTVTIVFDNQGLAGFHNHWVMDRMFSGNMLSSFAPGYDPENLTLRASDVKSIKKGAFDSLKKFNYFHHILIQGNNISELEAQDFNTKATTKGLVYEFFIPLYLNADSNLSKVTMSVYDDSFYTSIRILQFLISESDALDIKHTIGPVKSLTYYMGQVIPEGITFEFKKRPSETDPQTNYSKQPSENKCNNTNEIHPHELNQGWWQTIMLQINDWQAFLKDTMTDFGNEIKKNYWGKSFMLFILFSFLYGVIHALGPGHGKSIVSSYFIARPGSYLSGMLMAFVLSTTHALSGATFALVLKVIFESPVLFSRALPVERVSYALLIAIGLFLLIHAIVEMRKKGNETIPDHSNMKQLFVIAFTTGMIPCPGAAIILTFALSLNIIIAGVTALISMGIGMGLTTSVFAFAAIFSRKTLTSITESSKGFHHMVHGGLSIIGSLVIIMFGIVMFLT